MDSSLEMIFENAPDAIVRMDTDGRILRVNLMAEGLLGRERREILGKTFRELGLPEGWHEQRMSDIERIRRERNPCQRTFEHEGRYYETLLMPEINPEGRIVSVTAYSRDVSDRVAYRKILRSQRNYAKELLEALHEPMLVLDEFLKVKSANPQFLECFQVSSGEILGRPLEEVMRILNTPVPYLRSKLRECLRGGEPLTLEADVELPEEGVCRMLWHGSRIDHLREILLSLRDLTPHRREVSNLERDLRKQNRKLSLSHRKLKSLLVELSETEDRERDKLAEILHDEVQQLLVGLGLQLKGLRDKMTDGTKERRSIEESLEVLAQVIKLTRDLSHDMSCPASLYNRLEDVVDHLTQQMMSLHGLEVEVKIGEGAGTPSKKILALMRKAVREMLLNIVKHAKVEQATLEIVREGENLVVWVRDRGEGFDPDAVLNGSGDGGMGLFSIREQLAMAGGRLEVDSQPGQGSRFRLEFPLQERGALSDEVDLQDDRPSLDQAIRKEGEETVRLVLVDDHNAVREALAEFLDRQPGVDVVGQAADGREGLDVVEEERPDVVLMDLSMPNMSGAAASRELKRRFPDIRVVGLSMFPAEGIRDALADLGMDAYMEKCALLSEIFDQVVSGGPQAGADVAPPVDARKSEEEEKETV